MGRVKSTAQKKKITKPFVNQPAPWAEIPLTSGRDENTPEPGIQTQAQPRDVLRPDVEWYVGPPSNITARMLTNYLRKYELPGVTLFKPTIDQRANLPGDAWSRYHIEAGAILPLHHFY